MTKTIVAALLCASAAIAAPATVAAQAPSKGFTAAVTGGTLGIGPEAAFRGRHFGVRGNATFLSVSRGFDSDDIDYDGKIKLRSAGIMLDVFPTGSGFRLSAGARTNGNRARVVATPTAPTEVGGTVYTPTQIGTLTGRADTKNFAPALTVGYAGGLRSGFVFGVEAGALFQGKVRIREFTSSSNFASNPAFRASLEAERRDLQDDVDDYKVYPILQFSIGYRF
jgi:hypothetical protein